MSVKTDLAHAFCFRVKRSHILRTICRTNFSSFRDSGQDLVELENLLSTLRVAHEQVPARLANCTAQGPPPLPFPPLSTVLGFRRLYHHCHIGHVCRWAAAGFAKEWAQLPFLWLPAVLSPVCQYPCSLAFHTFSGEGLRFKKVTIRIGENSLTDHIYIRESVKIRLNIFHLLSCPVPLACIDSSNWVPIISVQYSTKMWAIQPAGSDAID